MYFVAAWSESPLDCSVWSKPRSHVYWKAAKAGAFGDDWWHENIRMGKAMFGVLCDKLRLHINKAVTKDRLPVAVAVDMRVAVTIWRLATNIEYRTIIAEHFGLGILTVCTIINFIEPLVLSHIICYH